MISTAWLMEETTAEVLNSIDSTSDNPIPVIYQEWLSYYKRI